MTSSEIEFLRPVRRCGAIERRTYGSHDWLLIEIDPPLLGQRLGLGGKDVDRVLITSRHEDTSLFPVSSWPVYVHVALPPEVSGAAAGAPLRSFGWAEIHPTLEAAAIESAKPR